MSWTVLPDPMGVEAGSLWNVADGKKVPTITLLGSMVDVLTDVDETFVNGSNELATVSTNDDDIALHAPSRFLHPLKVLFLFHLL